MKFIAHRGASCEAQEDTLEALLLASGLGAFAVECDPRLAKDGIVIFHDHDLTRLAGDPARVEDLTIPELRDKLAAKGLSLTTLDDLLGNYRGRASILLDFCFSPDDEFFGRLRTTGLPLIMGVHAPDEARRAARFFPPEQILAFMPKASDLAAFSEAGAGILRLWEPWEEVGRIPEIKASLPRPSEIFIMSCDPAIRHPLRCMDGSEGSIRRLAALGADGVLLNDIRMAVATGI